MRNTDRSSLQGGLFELGILGALEQGMPLGPLIIEPHLYDIFIEAVYR